MEIHAAPKKRSRALIRDLVSNKTTPHASCARALYIFSRSTMAAQGVPKTKSTENT